MFHKNDQAIKYIARIGLAAKGVIYVLLGFIGFMAAFELGHSNKEANQGGVFDMIQNSKGGNVLLGILAAGLFCYSIWRMIEALANDNQKKWHKRLVYAFSSLVYLSLGYLAISMALSGNSGDNGDGKQHLAAELMSKPFGQWLVAITGLILAGIGFYQVYYGISEKYKKHIQQYSLHSETARMLLRSGKIGYSARGVVWLIIAFLFMRAAFYHNASEAGDSTKAFQFIEEASYGSYLLGALGLGLIAYGVFSFMRARYETFN